jgi:hypothetical protein
MSRPKYSSVKTTAKAMIPLARSPGGSVMTASPVTILVGFGLSFRTFDLARLSQSIILVA